MPCSLFGSATAPRLALALGLALAAPVCATSLAAQRPTCPTPIATCVVGDSLTFFQKARISLKSGARLKVMDLRSAPGNRVAFTDEGSAQRVEIAFDSVSQIQVLGRNYKRAAVYGAGFGVGYSVVALLTDSTGKKLKAGEKGAAVAIIAGEVSLLSMLFERLLPARRFVPLYTASASRTASISARTSIALLPAQRSIGGTIRF